MRFIGRIDIDSCQYSVKFTINVMFQEAQRIGSDSQKWAGDTPKEFANGLAINGFDHKVEPILDHLFDDFGRWIALGNCDFDLGSYLLMWVSNLLQFFMMIFDDQLLNFLTACQIREHSQCSWDWLHYIHDC